MIIHQVWHFYGESRVPSSLRTVPIELSNSVLAELTSSYDVMLYRDKTRTHEIVLALDALGGRFLQR